MKTISRIVQIIIDNARRKEAAVLCAVLGLGGDQRSSRDALYGAGRQRPQTQGQEMEVCAQVDSAGRQEGDEDHARHSGREAQGKED